MVRRLDGTGDPITGEREIVEAEASVIQRIFREFSAGKSPRALAKHLNSENIPGPGGRPWMDTAIRGSAKRENGILNNELYIGKLVWNRQRFIKAPKTGNRVSRANPPETWIMQDVPELRIIEDELWNKAKALQKTMTSAYPGQEGKEFWDKRRPRDLFSGLLTCGICGGGFSMISKTHLGCSTARNKGTCDNRLCARARRLKPKCSTA